jgi:hypothetical protein
MDWSRPVPQRTAEQWRNADNAGRLLRMQYGAIAESLGGSASVDVREVSVSETDTGFRLDQAYTVRFSGIESGVESAIRDALAADPQFSDEQVDRLASAVSAVELRELNVDYSLDARDLTGEVRLDLRGYDELAPAYLESVQAIGPGTAGDALEQARARFEAQRAADLEQRYTWSASLSHPESGVVRAEVDAESRATNWATYVDELRSRDVPFVSREFELTGDLRDDRLAFNGSASLAGDDLFEPLTQGLPTGEEVPESSAAILEGLREAELQTAKATGSKRPAR